MVADSGARRRTSNGMSTAHLMARQRTYSRTLGRAASMLRVLVLIRCGLRRRGSKRKANGSTDQPKSHLSLHLFEPDPNGGAATGLLHVGEGKEVTPNLWPFCNSFPLQSREGTGTCPISMGIA